MGWTNTAAALKTTLEAIPYIGNVYLGDKHLRDEKRYRDLFQYTVTGYLDTIRGWRIARDSISEDWYSNTRSLAQERYVLRGVAAHRDAATSETTMQELVDEIFEAFRSPTFLGDADLIHGPTLGTMGYIQYGEVRSHYAEVVLTVNEYYTTTATAPALTTSNSRADARPKYQAVSEQFQAYVDALAGSGNVYAERQYSVDETDLLEKFLVEASDLVDVDDGIKMLLTTQIARLADQEVRHLGNTCETETGWRLNHHRSWSDTSSSYDEFQQHIDALRVVFRGLGNIGQPWNTNMVLSSPLQVPELGARMFVHHLCHFARCEVQVRESVYAAAG